MPEYLYSIINSSKLLNHQVASLLVYQSIFDNSVGKAFLNLLNTFHNNDESISASLLPSVMCLQAYGNWFKTLAATNQSWQEYLIQQILRNDNPFSQQVQQKSLEHLPSALLEAAKNDLQTLQNIYNCSTDKISQWVKTASQLQFNPTPWELPSENKELNFLLKYDNWGDSLPELASYYRQNGTGIYAEYGAFRWQENSLVGIDNPDPILLESLVGYEEQKKSLIKNTEFLLAGYSALNVLLYGSRGSGKSSLVKALLPSYKNRGLRLIEVNKSELKDLPIITDQLAKLPQKFIIFVDDLSFEEDDDSFKALKVVLEGSLTRKPKNVVVYATSNRRHLVREFFGDRPQLQDNSEIQAWDTVQEKLSFGDRFGLTLTFTPANQDTYLEIVNHLAKEAKINLKQEDLEFKAKQWATRNNGRSGRTAKQFIDFLEAELNYLKKG
jgi:uncharacterized protein